MQSTQSAPLRSERNLRRVLVVLVGAAFVAGNQYLVEAIDGQRVIGVGFYLLCSFWRLLANPARNDEFRFGKQGDADVAYVGSLLLGTPSATYRIPSAAVAEALQDRAERHDLLGFALALGLLTWLMVPNSLVGHAQRLAILVPALMAGMAALDVSWNRAVVRRLEPMGDPIDPARFAAERTRNVSTGGLLASVVGGLCFMAFGVLRVLDLWPGGVSHAIGVLSSGLGAWIVVGSSKRLLYRLRVPAAGGVGASSTPVG